MRADSADILDRWYQCEVSREELQELAKRSDLKGLLIGSVSHKVSQLSTCACLMVK